MDIWRQIRNMVTAFFSRAPLPRAELTPEQTRELGDAVRKQAARGDMAGRSVLPGEE